MLAAQLDFATHSLNVLEVPTPIPGYKEIRIKVKAAGVCLSDVHLIDGTISPAIINETGKVILGHEVAGIIDQIGKDVSSLKIGQRVLLHAGEIHDDKLYTRGVDYDGGWAEYAIASEETVVPIPNNLPFEQACFIPDAVSTPWAAISTTAAIKPAQAVGVWGIGGLGVHAIQLLRLVGAAPIIAIDPLIPVKDRALSSGADFFFTPEEIESKVYDITKGKGLDVALDLAGVTPVRSQAIKCLGNKGKLILIGLSGKPITIENSTNFSYLQKEIIGHYGSKMYHVEELVKFFEFKRLDFSQSVSDIFSLKDAPKAVDHLIKKINNPIRLILKP